MEKKATFIGVCKGNHFDRHSWEHTELVYEYRGHQYIVTKHNNGYFGDSLFHQHQVEQKRIDELIAHAEDPIPEYEYAGSAQEGFDLFWDYVNGEEN